MSDFRLICLFWKTHSPKPYPLITSFFLISILSISLPCTEMKMTVLESWDQTSSKTYFFIRKCHFEIWPYVTRSWPGSSLQLTCMGSDGKIASIFDSTCNSDYKSCAACPIFFFGGTSWPDLDPGPYLVAHLCSQDIFNSSLGLLWLSFEQKLSKLPVLGFIIRKRKNGLWSELTRELNSILKSKACFGEVLWRAFECIYGHWFSR